MSKLKPGDIVKHRSQLSCDDPQYMVVSGYSKARNWPTVTWIVDGGQSHIAAFPPTSLVLVEPFQTTPQQAVDAAAQLAKKGKEEEYEEAIQDIIKRLEKLKEVMPDNSMFNSRGMLISSASYMLEISI